MGARSEEQESRSREDRATVRRIEGGGPEDGDLTLEAEA